jgi:hypothetical protein
VDFLSARLPEGTAVRMRDIAPTRSADGRHPAACDLGAGSTWSYGLFQLPF